MKRIATRALLCVICLAAALGVLAGVAAAAEGKKAPKAGVKEKSYDDYVKALKAGNTEIDYHAFRMAHAKSAIYHPYSPTVQIAGLAYDSIEKGDYAGAIETANGLLDASYADLDGHMILFGAYRKKGDEKRASFHGAVFRGLVDSITSSGDGLTARTAMTVISVREEYVWFMANGFKPQKQELVEQDGHTFDRMTVEDTESGEEKVFYFNVDLLFEYLNKKSGK